MAPSFSSLIFNLHNKNLFQIHNVINYLKEYGIDPVVCDPWADATELQEFTGIELAEIESISNADAVVLAVAHDEYKNNMEALIKHLMGENSDKQVVIDVKGMVDRNSELRKKINILWRL